jgi:hypothetical protein
VNPLSESARETVSSEIVMLHWSSVLERGVEVEKPDELVGERPCCNQAGDDERSRLVVITLPVDVE